MSDFRQAFLAFSVARDVLRFGDFVTKAGRRTPYFFNAGLFNDGESLKRLGEFYAQALLASGTGCDQLFGPAYKGIPLASATAIALAGMGHLYTALQVILSKSDPRDTRHQCINRLAASQSSQRATFLQVLLHCCARRFTLRPKWKVDVQWTRTPFALVHHIGKIHTFGALL